MANRLWMFNPGCATEPCCKENDPVNTPCCTGLVPKRLYLSDGFGEVEMVYNGPRPVSLGTHNSATLQAFAEASHHGLNLGEFRHGVRSRYRWCT